MHSRWDCEGRNGREGPEGRGQGGTEALLENVPCRGMLVEFSSLPQFSRPLELQCVYSYTHMYTRTFCAIGKIAWPASLRIEQRLVCASACFVCSPALSGTVL